MPQYAMAQLGSWSSTALNVLCASGNQYECCIATAASKSGCTLGSQDVGNVTLPSWSGSSCEWATPEPNSRTQDIAVKRRGVFIFISVSQPVSSCLIDSLTIVLPIVCRPMHLFLDKRCKMVIIFAMNLRHLRAFAAIAATGGFARAAERLHLSQP